jgi:hypothetical protein
MLFGHWRPGFVIFLSCFEHFGNCSLKGVKESATDFIGDMMGDLESMIRERMKAVNYGAAVTGIKYDLAGDVTDIEVNVSFGTE